MSSLDLRSARFRKWALEAGFDRVGICPAVEADGYSRLIEWLQRGYAGEMEFLERRREAYRHPRHVLEGVRSLIVLAMSYSPLPARPIEPGWGRVSRYAWGDGDYHDVVHEALRQFMARIQEECPASRARGVVDTAPLLEREFAQLAGLGWIGKNTLLLNRQLGSYFFLAVVLIDEELAYDAPSHTDHCGTCTACLDACPTQAFPRPYVLDATRCISYLTIEHRSSIPVSLRGSLGEWIFGCDICQDVCPWNRRAPLSRPLAFQPREDLNPVELARLFQLDDDAFRRQFRHTAIWRARRRGLLRNAALVLGNQPDEEGIAALALAIADREPLVREAAVWSLGNYGKWPVAAALVRQRQVLEDDPLVRQAIADVLGVL